MRMERSREPEQSIWGRREREKAKKDKGERRCQERRSETGRRIRGTNLSVRRERDAVDGVRVSSEPSELNAGLGVPEADDGVKTSGSEEAAVGGEGDAAGKTKASDLISFRLKKEVLAPERGRSAGEERHASKTHLVKPASTGPASPSTRSSTLRSNTHAPVSMSQILALLSPEPETTCRPSAEKSIE